LDECKVTDDPDEKTSKASFNSGYNHGCSDAKISDPSKRYINQTGKGPSYHTSNFMNGYYDGFGDCLKPGNKNPVADAGPDKIELFEGQTITLDARNSYDPDGKIVKYEWRNGVNADPGCPYGKFTNKNSPTTQFVTPTSLTKDCSNWYEVVVTDNYGKRGVDAILITVKQL
ncbi:MAG: hypothetical protein H0W19_08900, partial [Nitrosopumilus sp.]|nr:hypothetical protein [Nitrosopumilus sp.]